MSPPFPLSPFPPPSALNPRLITPPLTRYHLLLCFPLSLLFPHPPHTIHASTLYAPPPPPNGSNFSMVVTISHINYPETHLPRFTPSLFCYLLISNFPLSHHFLPSTPNTSPGVYFDHSLINLFFLFFFKLLCQYFSLPQQHPSTSHFISFPPSKISNSANFHIPNITSPHQDPPPKFHAPNISLLQNIYSANVSPIPLPTVHLPPLLTFLRPTINPPTLFTNPPLQNISRSTFLLPTIIPLTLFIAAPPPPPPPNNIPSSSTIYYFCSLNSSSNIIHYTAHSSHTNFPRQNFTLAFHLSLLIPIFLPKIPNSILSKPFLCFHFSHYSIYSCILYH